MATATLVGLDIGSVSIRAVEITRRKDNPVITNFGQVPLPGGAVQGGVIQDPQTVTQALKHLWASTKFRTRKVALGVTNPQVVVREMAVTNLPRRELRKSLAFQVRDMLPLAVERSLLDFYPLEDPGKNEKVRGLLIAAPKEAVMTAIDVIERAGLHTERVDLASFALVRAVAGTDSQVEALVDIGAHLTIVVVHTEGRPLIVRTIPRGGAEITQMIATQLGGSVAEAEAVKCRIGMRTDEDVDTAEVVREAARPLINEIRSSFAYLTAGERTTKVARLALSGGGALMPGLPSALTALLNVEVVLADPTMRLRAPRRRGKHNSIEAFRSSAAVSIGLTLGAA